MRGTQGYSLHCQWEMRRGTQRCSKFLKPPLSGSDESSTRRYCYSPYCQWEMRAVHKGVQNSYTVTNTHAYQFSKKKLWWLLLLDTDLSKWKNSPSGLPRDQIPLLSYTVTGVMDRLSVAIVTASLYTHIWGNVKCVVATSILCDHWYGNTMHTIATVPQHATWATNKL